MPRRAKKKAADDGNINPAPTRELRPRRAAAADNANKPGAPENPSKKMPSDGAKKATGKRTTGRASKKWSEPFVTTNAKSPLVGIDLVIAQKLFANPKAWTCLEEEEKREILSLLPDDVHPNPDGNPEDPNSKIEPLPYEFLRYSNPWRDAVRQYQIDLANGRYDPEWQRQAHQAVEERAAGKFDKWKEEQFEEFWGQKQKIDHGLIAGESSRVKLETLVQNNLVQIGDVWKYSRVFGKREARILIEKELKIIGSDGKSLTFAIPPGQRAFLCGVIDDTPIANSESQISDVKRTKESCDAPDNSVGAIKTTLLPTSSDPEIPNSQSTGQPVDVNAVSFNDIKVPSSFQQCNDANTEHSDPTDPFLNGNLLASLHQFVSDLGAAPNPEGPIEDETLVDVESGTAPPCKSIDNVTVNPSISASIGIVSDAPFAKSGTYNFDESLKELFLDSSSELSDLPSDFEYGDIDVSWDPYRFQFSPQAETAKNTSVASPKSHSSMELDTRENTAGYLSADTEQRHSPMKLDSCENTTERISPEFPKDTNAMDVENASGNTTKDTPTPDHKPNEMAHEDSTFQASTTTPSNHADQKTTNAQPQLKDIVFSGVRGPTSLHNKILQIDGRITNPPNGNAWKDFRCYRNNQDMGSLWEIRQAWYLRTR
ncbi:hypothetical protein PRK78_007005 [Emydomyces testavorans]|uniref:DEUBAD domain-containing protein n=1 Tax=Emydomyces testavorans TaxID=2070801 RepID=A0AAF0DME3_9EURO|nr:hypothetical protein PRK78_007005 [Emydomyces testavorans]